MATPDNVLKTVQTYQTVALATLLNENWAIDNSNKTLDNFQNKSGNLGDSITFTLYNYNMANAGLIAQFNPYIQRQATLPCTQSANSSNAFSEQEFLFNTEAYVKQVSLSAVYELGSLIESDILKNIVSGVTVFNPQDARNGKNINPTSGPYRFYSAGITSGAVNPINSFGQLAQMTANFRAYGWDKKGLKCVLPIESYPSIINSGLNQFAMNRNNEYDQGWRVGDFDKCEFGSSNLLPIHTAGTVGNTSGSGSILTLVSTNDPTGANVTQLTLSGATASDADAIKSGDLSYIVDGTSGLPNMRYRLTVGHQVSSRQVQIRVLEDADSDSGGNVVINIFPALVSVPGVNQNLSSPLQAGMKFQFMPSHKAGLIMSGDPLYTAMPKMSSMNPYESMSTHDPETGAAIRSYWGNLFGQNTQGWVTDQIWGSTLVSDNCERVLLPLS